MTSATEKIYCSLGLNLSSNIYSPHVHTFASFMLVSTSGITVLVNLFFWHFSQLPWSPQQECAIITALPAESRIGTFKLAVVSLNMPQYSCGLGLQCRTQNSNLHHHNTRGVFGGIFDLFKTFSLRRKMFLD